MDIKELTERYRDRFDAHYLQDDNGTGRKGRKRKKEVETPNFLKDVIRPILDTLPDLLPEYGFTKLRMITPCTASITVSRRVSSSWEVFPSMRIYCTHAIVPWQSLR